MNRSDLSIWAKQPASWITSPGLDEGAIVISSRVRIARNVMGFPFPHNASSQIRAKLKEDILQILKTVPQLKTSVVFSLQNLKPLERAFLMERQLISQEQTQPPLEEKGLLVSAGENVSIMINEEDHIRAACFKPGLSLVEAWNMLNGIDDALSSELEIAYDSDFGFLTACLTNTGTGLRASCLLHLPALAITGQIQETVQKLENARMAVRGFYGEGTSAVGNLFQISNSSTLGVSEDNILNRVKKTVESLAQLERKTAESLLSSSKKRQTEDLVFRSLGTLQSSRLLGFEEAMHHVSLIRLGKRLQIPMGIDCQDITNLFFLIQPAHIWLRNELKDGQTLDEPAERASLLRDQTK